MWPDPVSNPGPLTYESDFLPTALRGPATVCESQMLCIQLDPKQLSGGIFIVPFSRLFHCTERSIGHTHCSLISNKTYSVTPSIATQLWHGG